MKIAILRRGGFGDLICTVPLVHCIQEKFPNASMTLFLEERSHVLAPFLFSDVDYSLIHPGNKYYQALKRAFVARGQFDLAISAKTTPMKLNDRFLRVLKAPISMAVSQNRRISHPRQIQNSGHQALRCLKIFDPEIEEIPDKWRPQITPPDGPNLVQLPKPVLLFSLSNRRPSSQLAWERFAEIANCLPFSILINSMKPHPDAESLQKTLKVPSQIFLTPHLPDLLKAIQGSNLVLTGDGGLCHITAALMKPQVALYACTPLELWKPLGPSICLFDFQNVNRIDPQMILSALSKFA